MLRLAGMCVLAAASASAQVKLNHVQVIVDHGTYTAAAVDAFLQSEFAPSEQRTTVRTDQTYSGLYFYGKHTYFELFDRSKESDPLTRGAIGFGVDEAKLEQIPGYPHAHVEHIDREFAGVRVPWFDMLVTATVDGLRTWVMQYDPSFLDAWHPNPRDPAGRISRADILERYSQVLPKRPQRPLLSEVAGFTLALTEAGAAALTEQCRAWGYQVSSEHGEQLLKNSDLEIRIIPAAPGAPVIRSLTFRLQHAPPSRAARKMGGSIIEFPDDSTAVWTF